MSTRTYTVSETREVTIVVPTSTLVNHGDNVYQSAALRAAHCKFYGLVPSKTDCVDSSHVETIKTTIERA